MISNSAPVDGLRTETFGGRLISAIVDFGSGKTRLSGELRSPRLAHPLAHSLQADLETALFPQ
jgi:hypothetical protein